MPRLKKWRFLISDGAVFLISDGACTVSTHIYVGWRMMPHPNPSPRGEGLLGIREIRGIRGEK